MQLLYFGVIARYARQIGAAKGLVPIDFLTSGALVMDGDLRAHMTAGVFVEYHDERGNTVGQALFTGWQGRPVPNIGDLVCCVAQLVGSRNRRKLLGRVTHRQFEMQHDGDGQPSVWVRLALEVVSPPTAKPKPQPRIRFSAN